MPFRKNVRKVMIDWKFHAKRFYLNWKYADNIAMAHYGRYRKWKDRAKRAEERVEQLEFILAEIRSKI